SDIDTAGMCDLLDVFGQYLRASFDFCNSERVVPLEHELSLVRSYLFVEQERFEQRFRFYWEVGEGLVMDFPPRTIGPLVENAVRHGIMKRFEGSRIKIRISDHVEYDTIHIEDNGVGMNDTTLEHILDNQTRSRGSGIGLLNVDRRLKQIYGKGLQI